MLYIKDGGFYVGAKGNPIAVYSDDRIDELRYYYKENFEKVVIAMESGVILKRSNNFYFVRNFGRFDTDSNDIFKNLYLVEEFNYKHYTIKEMKSKNNFLLKKNDETFEKIKEDDIVYIFETSQNMLLDGDIIWEYFKYIEQ